MYSFLTVAGFGGPYVLSNVHEHTVRRRLAEETRNLHAAPGSDGPLNQVVSVPPTASGSFPAIRDKSKLKPSLSPISPSLPPVSPSITHPESTPTSVVNDLTSSRRSAMWKYILVLLVAALFLALATCIFLVCHSKGVATIGPWKTGLSGQLQKAFVTGISFLCYSLVGQ